MELWPFFSFIFGVRLKGCMDWFFFRNIDIHSLNIDPIQFEVKYPPVIMGFISPFHFIFPGKILGSRLYRLKKYLFPDSISLKGYLESICKDMEYSFIHIILSVFK